jgi:hypothetical protein
MLMVVVQLITIDKLWNQLKCTLKNEHIYVFIYIYEYWPQKGWMSVIFSNTGGTGQHYVKWCQLGTDSFMEAKSWPSRNKVE